MGDLIGSMREQITIRQKSGTTRDASGASSPTVTTIGPIYAAVKFKEIGSDEKQLADQRTAITTVHFTIRNNPSRTISTRDDIVYRGMVYDIRSVLDLDERRQYLLIETEQTGENLTA